MKHKLGVLAAVTVLLLVMSSTALAAPAAPKLSATELLNAPDVLETTFNINVVFVGYEASDIDESDFEGELPSTYDPLVRVPHVYYGIDLPVNIHGDYTYNYTFAESDFNDAFFGYLTSIGVPGGLTDQQAAYNEQENRLQTVTDPVLYIDAPSTERWLMDNARSRLGLDVANYTIFFVNWWGREDFQFHVYTKTDDPDPDTGVNFGAAYDSRKIIAWGGSFGRTWFYDLSAGPESWTDNWNINDAEIDSEPGTDYRMPPVWEYGNLTGYRPFDNLSQDLGLVARYVAINLLFTSSPLYDPLVTEPFPGRGKRVLINMFEDNPNSSGLDLINKQYIDRTLRTFQTQYGWRITIKDQPLKGSGLRRPFRIWAGIRQADDCWNEFGDIFAELFCYVDENRSDYLPPIKPLKRYVEGIFAFNTTDERMGINGGLLGYADDDWVSGTPTYVFEFETPGAAAAGFGFSTTTTHEFGHHIGMSHPHDGYDSESDVDYEPTGDYYFVWSGDESHTIMQYIALANQFGWFDRDNMNRFLAGRYIQRAGEIAAKLGTVESSGEARGLISDASSRLADSRSAFRSGDYQRSAEQARAGFERVYRAAALAGMTLPMAEPLPGGVRRTDIPRWVDTLDDKLR